MAAALTSLPSLPLIYYSLRDKTYYVGTKEDKVPNATYKPAKTLPTAKDRVIYATPKQIVSLPPLPQKLPEVTATNMQKVVEKLEGQVTTLNGKIGQLTEQLKTATSNVQVLKDELQRTQTLLTTTQKDLELTRVALQNVTTQLGVLQGSVERIMQIFHSLGIS